LAGPPLSSCSPRHGRGDKDFISIEHAASMLELIPNAQLAVLPGATHVEMTRRPDQVLAKIVPFLQAST
jgi:pimeloyl-ACP methyl ester carboxylesterase